MKVKIEAMLVSVHPLDWLGGSPEFGREFLMVVLCLPVCCLLGIFVCYIEGFSLPHSPNRGYYQVC